MSVMTTAVSAPKQYINCEFKIKPYEKVCNIGIKKGVSLQYANAFLLSFKATKLDMKSFELFRPKKIAIHAANEKRANNSLLKYIHEIVNHLKQYQDVYEYTETKYHVNREIIAAILMKETRLGKIKSRHDAFIVFNTLILELKQVSERDKRLMKMAQENLASIMHYCYKKHIEPNDCNFASSYAGAVGIPQFMPQNFKYIEGYKTALGNLSKMNDAIVSASHFLQQNAQFDQLIDWSKIPPMSKIENAWYDYDFKIEGASFAYTQNKFSGKQYKCYSCDNTELQYLREYIKKIMKYNHSSNYAVGVLRLAYEARLNQLKQ